MISFSTLFAMQRYIDTNGDVNLNENLVAHYLLNNNADDSYGAYEGTPSGGVDFQGDSAYFDGVDDYVTLATSSTSLSTYTMSFWFKPITMGGADGFMHTVESSGKTSTTHVFGDIGFTMTSAGRVDYAFKRFNGTVYPSLYSGDGEVSIGNLYHVVLVGSSTDHKMYIDGALVTTTLQGAHSEHASLDLSTTFLSLEHRPSLSYNEMDISNVRLYSDAKNQTFITELYAEGYYPKPLTEPTTTDLIAHYPLTGTAEDTMGNYDGTEGGNTYVDDAEFGSVASFVNTIITTGVAQSIFNSDFALSINFNPASLADFQSVLGMRDTSTNGIESTFYNGNFTFTMYSTSGTWLLLTHPTSEFSTNIWYNVIVVREANVVSMYIDDVLVDSDTYIGTFLGLGNIILGRSYSGRNYVGKQRQMRIYNNSITRQEITDIYNYDTNFRPIDIDDGLIAYYPLSSNSLDNYYNEYDGTDTDMTYNGESASFNGTSSWINTSLNSSSTTFSISLWVNPDTVDNINSGFLFDTANRVILNNGNSGDANPYLTYWDGVVYEDWSHSLAVGEKEHIVLVVDGTTATLYSNTVDKGDITVASNSIGNGLSFGARNSDGGASWFDGKMSMCRVYDKTLTPEQIEIIYNEEYIAPIVEPVFDQALLYDVNNIATEFIV